MERLGQRVETAPVLQREAEQVGDHERRHLAGYVGDQVARASFRDGVDDPRGELLDAGPKRPYRPRREAGGEQLAVLRVGRRVPMSIISWSPSRGPAVASGIMMVGDDENFAGSRPTALTS
jgi:hypothetical protein